NSGKDAMAEFVPETSPSGAAFERYELGKKPLGESADALARLAVTHVVATSQRLIALLKRSPRFRLAWREDQIAIFRIVRRAGQPSAASLLSTSGAPLAA